MYERPRNQLVEKFVVQQGIEDSRVIVAMRRIPRHLFVSPAISHQAYQGGSLPIGYGQTISHPTTVALMSQLLQITGGEKVLEIGTGSGYQAAVLAEMGAKVFTIERIAGLGEQTRRLLEKLGYYSVAVKIGDGSIGWNEFAPYHRIIVTAGAPAIPENLLNQLADGGRLIMGTVLKVIHNVIDLGMGIQEACASLFVDASGDRPIAEADLAPSTLEALRAMGHELDLREKSFLPRLFASPTGILVDRASGRLHGGADPFHPGVALGY